MWKKTNMIYSDTEINVTVRHLDSNDPSQQKESQQWQDFAQAPPQSQHAGSDEDGGWDRVPSDHGEEEKGEEAGCMAEDLKRRIAEAEEQQI